MRQRDLTRSAAGTCYRNGYIPREFDVPGLKRFFTTAVSSRRVFQAFTLCTVQLGVVSLLTMPAQATSIAAATNERDIFLAQSSPNGYADNPAAGPRVIYLAAGNYDWGYQFIDKSGLVASRNRRIYLAAATYDWLCRVEGLQPGGLYNYESQCWLGFHGQPEVAILTQQPDVVLPEGTYHWVGILEMK